MSRTFPLPTHLICESGAFEKLQTSDLYPELTERSVTVISGKGPTCRITERIVAKLKLRPSRFTHLLCTDNTLQTIGPLEAEVRRHSTEVIIGIGGGTVLDVVKWIGWKTALPCMLVPTALSNDAVCSPVASIRVTPKGKLSIMVGMPWAVVIDLDIAALSPPRLFASGAGELLSNITALEDWQLAHRVKKEKIDPFAFMLANQAAQSFIHADGESRISPASLLRITAEALIMSGIAMAVAGSSRPCSGSEHLISHALDLISGGKALHGEQVALAALISEHLQGKGDPGSSLRPLFKRFRLPTHYAELGYSKEEMIAAIRQAPSLRNRYTILHEAKLTPGQIGSLLDDVFPSL